MGIIENITNIWGGIATPFPIIRNRGENTYLYRREGQQNVYAVIATYAFDEDYIKTPDIMIDAYEVKDLFICEDLFTVPIILAVQYNDLQVFSNIANYYQERKRYYHKGNMFLPKNTFNNLIKTPQKDVA